MTKVGTMHVNSNLSCLMKKCKHLIFWQSQYTTFLRHETQQQL